MNIGLVSYGSSSGARKYLQGKVSTDSGCCKVAQVSNLGQQAISVTANTEGTTVLAAFGANVLTVNITWSEAAAHPEMAVTLARDAAARL